MDIMFVDYTDTISIGLCNFQFFDPALPRSFTMTSMLRKARLASKSAITSGIGIHRPTCHH
ncbi:MAG: hypothetical protein VKO39_01855 [Cyanobacteriota bacterium]|nr:hypothetical protein [Cyanobacteriota bacterium]